MIKENVEVFENKEKLYEAFTAFVKKMLEVYPIMNFSLSGGSTPKGLFEYWSKLEPDALDWGRIVFFWGDERCVPPENAMSNFGMTKDFLFNKVERIVPKGWRRIHGENDPEEEAEWYSRILSTKINKKNEIPTFELMMIGLGDDGHTVSIFPENIELWDDDQICVVSEHPQTKMKRISITGKVVNNAQHVVFLVTGKNKAEKVRDIIQNRAKFSDIYPAAKVKPRNGYLHWFLDSEAASLL